jgi:hypothetical protein
MEAAAQRASHKAKSSENTGTGRSWYAGKGFGTRTADINSIWGMKKEAGGQVA